SDHAYAGFAAVALESYALNFAFEIAVVFEHGAGPYTIASIVPQARRGLTRQQWSVLFSHASQPKTCVAVHERVSHCDSAGSAADRGDRADAGAQRTTFASAGGASADRYSE